MKKILVAGIMGLGLVGCSEYSVDNMSSAKIITSQFDGAREIVAQKMPALVDGGWVANGVSFGAKWSNKEPNIVAFDVELNNTTTNLQELLLSIDGQITKHSAIGTFTNFGGTGNLRNSSRLFAVDVNTARKLASSKDVKFKVVTLSNGYREGVLISGKQITPAAKSLINVINQIK